MRPYLPLVRHLGTHTHAEGVHTACPELRTAERTHHHGLLLHHHGLKRSYARPPTARRPRSGASAYREGVPVGCGFLVKRFPILRSLRRRNLRNRRRREALALHGSRSLKSGLELSNGSEPGHRLAFISKCKFEDRFVGFDGRSLNASKCLDTPSKPTSARRPPEPTKRSGRGHPSVRVDP